MLYRLLNISILFSFLFFGQSITITAQEVVRGPYLNSTTDNSIIIRWRTDIPTESVVTYGSTQGNLTETTSNSSLTTEHIVKLSGLLPHTFYYYAVGDQNTMLSGPDNLHYFRTNPIPGTPTPLRLWTFGDQGKGNTGQAEVRDAYINFAGNTYTDIFLWLGDNAYNDGTDEEYQEKAFDMYPDELKYMPLWLTPGNHDYNSICPIGDVSNPLNPNLFCPQDPMTHTGPYYDIFSLPVNGEAGGVPSGTELYYSFDYGNVRFISLNSELGSRNPEYNYTGVDFNSVLPLISASAADAENSPMMQWLKADLADAKEKGRDWIIAYWHQAPYSRGSHDTDDVWELYMQAMRENWNPVIEEAGVDLVIAGHSHVFERSYLINGFYTGTSNDFNETHKVDGSSGNYDTGEPYIKTRTGSNANKGTVYVVIGNGGSSTSDPGMDHPVHYAGHGCGSCYGSFILDIEGNRLDGTYLAYDGTVMDEFTIIKEDASSIPHKDSPLDYVNVYPNPFAGQTQIEFTLSKNSDVLITVYDLSGKKVAKLYEQNNLLAGTYKQLFDAQKMNLSKNAYIIEITINGTESIQRVVKFQ